MSPRPDEIGGKEQPIARPLEQHVHVLAGRDAAEQHHREILRRVEACERAPKRLAIARFVGSNLGGPEGAQVVARDRRVRREQPLIGGDDLYAGHAGRWPREPLGVGQLATKVEAAEEAERFAQRHAGAGPEPLGQGKPAATAQEQLCALAAAVRRREQKDASGRGTGGHAEGCAVQTGAAVAVVTSRSEGRADREVQVKAPG